MQGVCATQRVLGPRFTQPVGSGKEKGKAPNHAGKVCPVNRYSLMTSNSDKGDGDYVRLIGVDRRKGKQWDRSRSERSMSG
jgi:hypothetical protein